MTGHTYTPTVWEDEIPESTPVKYKLTDDTDGVLGNSVKIEVVTPVTAGTPLNATTENNQEEGISNAQSDANDALDAAAAAQADALLAVLLYSWRDSSYTMYANGNEPLTTTHKVLWSLPNEARYAHGATLMDIRAINLDPSSSGDVVLTVSKYIYATDTWVSLLTTPITIEAGERFSITATVQPTITEANKNFAENDNILVEVTSAGTGVTHCQVDVVFRPIEET